MLLSVRRYFIAASVCICPAISDTEQLLLPVGHWHILCGDTPGRALAHGLSELVGVLMSSRCRIRYIRG